MTSRATTVRAGLDVVVLAGGAGSRIGGRDKAELRVGGVRLLDRALAAAAPARSAGGSAVVVGPERPPGPARGIRWARENPAGGGPLAAVAAGLVLVSAPRVALLAVDLPFVTWPALCRLSCALDGHPTAAGALYVDAGGRDQLLFGMWRTAELRAVIPHQPHGRSLRGVVAELDVAGLGIVRLPAGDEVDVLDCDTEPDLDLARCRATPAGSLHQGRSA